MLYFYLLKSVESMLISNLCTMGAHFHGSRDCHVTPLHFVPRLPDGKAGNDVLRDEIAALHCVSFACLTARQAMTCWRGTSPTFISPRHREEYWSASGKTTWRSRYHVYERPHLVGHSSSRLTRLPRHSVSLRSSQWRLGGWDCHVTPLHFVPRNDV